MPYGREPAPIVNFEPARSRPDPSLIHEVFVELLGKCNMLETPDVEGGSSLLFLIAPILCNMIQSPYLFLLFQKDA